MDLTKKDRLFLINQYKILAFLNPDEAKYYDELIEILQNGYAIFYSQLHEWISDDVDAEAGRFVLDILNLYRAVENIKRSTKDEALIKHYYSFFHGFDGNNEGEYFLFCRFLIETQGKFQEQLPYLGQNDNLNSHTPMTGKYQRMLEASKRVSSIWEMTPEEALRILDA
jgi:uncharacterized protein YfbU (UPF0304 family)